MEKSQNSERMGGVWVYVLVYTADDITIAQIFSGMHRKVQLFHISAFRLHVQWIFGAVASCIESYAVVMRVENSSYEKRGKERERERQRE